MNKNYRYNELETKMDKKPAAQEETSTSTVKIHLQNGSSISVKHNDATDIKVLILFFKHLRETRNHVRLFFI